MQKLNGGYLQESPDGTETEFYIIGHLINTCLNNKVNYSPATIRILILLILLTSCKKEKITFPVVLTSQVSEITQNCATSGGIVISAGGAEVTERGVCWSISRNPDKSGDKTNNGSGTGAFLSNLERLIPNTTYYIRAYASNIAGTGYGTEAVFTTKKIEPPELITLNVSAITQTSAVSGGEITSDNGGLITERGICWSTESEPTISENKSSDGTGTGRYVSIITDLRKGIKYFVRAYAKNIAGISYGNELSFNTLSTSPELSTIAVTSIRSHEAISGGIILSDGGDNITSKGVCWSTLSNPTIDNEKTSDGTGSQNFSSIISNLKEGTTYNVRSYAINNSGIAYGNNLTFTTLPELPTVNTLSVSGITTTSALAGGNVIKDGGSQVISRGLCWATHPLPDLSGNHTSNGAGNGIFNSIIQDLDPGTIYYIRAYATNVVGTEYGEVKSFRTLKAPIIADHSIVVDFEKIPDSYIAQVKKMMINFRGESHGVAYKTGMVLLEGLYPDCDCNISIGENYTDKYLRIDNAEWIGEEEWFTWSAFPPDSRPPEKDFIKNYIKNYFDAGHPLTVLGFAWCYDHVNGGPTGLIDSLYGISWYGFSVGGPDGNKYWGLDANDYSITQNRVSMDTYLNTTLDYINYCKTNNYPTKVIFTTCPVDNGEQEKLYEGERGYQGHLKQEYIRSFVKADTSRILFDYADILCYDDDGRMSTTIWNGHKYPCITPANLGDGSIGHIGTAGAIRLAKAQWWLLARIAGWNGK